MNLVEVLRTNVLPGMALLPDRMDTPEARVMMLAIGLQESRFVHRRQIKGPARGFWQFEQGGGVIGVVSRQLGIGSFSPRLDAKGNSARGVNAMGALANELGLHVFDCTNTGSSFVEQMLR